jgi:hypothetical protein
MRGRRLATLAVAATLALGGLVGLGATPAAADPPGGVLRGVYFDYSFCNNYGFEGAAAGSWDWYYCEQRYSYWFLWTFTY